jgi:hypothetical protein
MSKVYSFRLDKNNPREAQAREVINAWVGEGYSLRHVVVDALLSYKKAEAGHDELNSVVEQLQDLILALDKQPAIQSSEASLSNSFLDAVKQSVKNGVKVP